ncbi:hypothetical protein LshimejAT787_0110070 [Lyophyllum shimeji]|uniref:Uncharacterized protein n=1 Tax=Lyophyllum shimeji TaxID=47721 RepID=A0A9P3PDZ5_LYOSH|nr:hypothetical protein LshimejAT787_0110070 [Lyophyllum shimeji]
MAGTPLAIDGAQYACKCLNVRIRPAATKSVFTDFVEDPNFTPVFVGEEGITVAHPQVTVRTRTRGVPIAGTTRFSRYMTITCLLCDLLVYRVYQTYSADVEGKDGPVLPTEDWVERDILKSLSGWIEVQKDCLTGIAVEQAMLSPHYSDTFDLLLPAAVSPPTPSEPIFERPPSRSSISPPPPPPKFFSNVQPVFLPPPFTPSHPVFAYLSSVAAKESQAVRDAAEDYMTEQLKSKTSEIENTDAELRRKVDVLWKKFRENLSRIQPETELRTGRRATSTSRSRERSAVSGLEASITGTPIAVRNFIPTSVTRTRSSSPPAPRVSALSASLATSSFHHPKARSTARSPPPDIERTSSPVSTASPRTGSATLVSPPLLDASNVVKIRRNIDERVDTATSYRFFLTLEEDMARLRGRRLVSEGSQPSPTQTQQNGPPLASGSNIINGDKSQKQLSESQLDLKESIAQTEGQREEGEITPSRGQEKSKGKRKVTFDVKPAVVTIKREVEAEKEEEEALANEDERDMIFDLEDLEEGDTQASPSSPRPTLQLVEQPVAPTRSRKSRPQNGDTLSTSFSGLRPTSLPAPSHIRPARGQHGTDLSSPSMVLSLPKPSLPLRTEALASSVPAGSSGSQSPIDESQDPELLKLLAADTPSHRGAWKPDSKAWQTFVRRPTGNHRTGAIPEEGEEDPIVDTSGSVVPGMVARRPEVNDNQEVLVGSLPIAMKAGKRKEELSLASYQPKTLAAQSVPTPPVGQRSSTAIRKAVYAERDRSRSLDPGPLDFPTEDEEEHEEKHPEDASEGAVDTSEAGGRGRKAALKILKARSDLPEAGMWRSLA